MRAVIYLFLVIGIAVILYWQEFGESTAVNVAEPLSGHASSLQVIPENNVVFDISVHSVDELRSILRRAEELVTGPRSASQPATIAIMLHGREIEYFAIDKYAEYRDIVDLAARLDAYNVIEFKMCETAMKDYGIEKTNIPGFIEFVPNGDRELEQLSRKGYAIM